MSLLEIGTQLAADYRRVRARTRLNFDDFTRPNDRPQESLLKAVEWLRTAHRTTGHRGTPRGYSLLRGWQSARSELTAAVATTLMVHARRAAAKPYLQEAEVMLKWLADQQQADGGVPMTDNDVRSSVAATGASVAAWLHGYRMTGNPEYMTALRHGADFLAWAHTDDTRWQEHCEGSSPHTGLARVATALLDAAQLTGNPDHRHGALHLLEWVLDQQHPNGFFERCSTSRPGAVASTRRLAETTRGLVEAYVLYRDPRLLDAVRVTSDAMEDHFRITESLPAYFDGELRPTCTYECLVGLAGFAVVWMELAAIPGNARYRESATRTTRLLQSLMGTTRSTTTDGAVKATHPIWGLRLPLQFPVRATVSLADALLLRLIGGHEESSPLGPETP